MPKEERRISPAIVIIPIGLGLAAVMGIAALAWAAPPAAPPIIYTCPYCGAEFNTEAELLDHIAAEHPEQPPVVWYTCPHCGAKFTNKGELLTHIEAEHPEIPPGTGMITLYMTGLSTEEWTVGWYYAAEDKFRYHLEDYHGAPNTRWRAPYDPCTPPPEYPIDLNNLIVKIETFSNVHVCPKTGYKGYCSWGVFGPFVVEDGGIYTLNPVTGELVEGRV